MHDDCLDIANIHKHLGLGDSRVGISVSNPGISASNFLLNTPTKALSYTARFPEFWHRDETQTPASILNRRRYQQHFLYKSSAIARAAAIPASLRGDQPPQTDDEVTIETIDGQHGHNSNRNTIMPVYFTNDRDTTIAQRTETVDISPPYFCLSLLLSLFFCVHIHF